VVFDQEGVREISFENLRNAHPSALTERIRGAGVPVKLRGVDPPRPAPAGEGKLAQEVLE
jgi:hypothetical protein